MSVLFRIDFSNAAQIQKSVPSFWNRLLCTTEVSAEIVKNLQQLTKTRGKTTLEKIVSVNYSFKT